MTDQFRADLDHIEAVTAQLESLNRFVSESLAEIDERIAAVQANWSGAAADAHATAHAEWISAAENSRLGLEKMKRAATAARASYEAGTVANLSALGRGRSGLAPQ